jgi:hypothetical protein
MAGTVEMNVDVCASGDCVYFASSDFLPQFSLERKNKNATQPQNQLRILQNCL